MVPSGVLCAAPTALLKPGPSFFSQCPGLMRCRVPSIPFPASAPINVRLSIVHDSNSFSIFIPLCANITCRKTISLLTAPGGEAHAACGRVGKPLSNDFPQLLCLFDLSFGVALAESG